MCENVVRYFSLSVPTFSSTIPLVIKLSEKSLLDFIVRQLAGQILHQLLFNFTGDLALFRRKRISVLGQKLLETTVVSHCKRPSFKQDRIYI